MVLTFIKENATWLVPICVAIIAGIFTLLKKNKDTQRIHTSQKIKNCNNNTINQIGGNQNYDGKRRTED